MERRKSDFRAMREMVGLTQDALAREVGVALRSVKRWEDPKLEWYQPPQDAWDALDAYLETQDQMVREVSGEVLEMVERADRKPEAVPITYYRTQAQFDELGRDEGYYGIANANARALASELRRAGLKVFFRYPDEGAVSTPGSGY